MSESSQLPPTVASKLKRLLNRIGRGRIGEQLTTITAQLEELNQNLARVERAAGVERETTREELLRHMLQTRLMTSRRQWQLITPPTSAPPTIVPRDFASDLQTLAGLHPHLFDKWKQINFVDNPIEFAERPAGSCSVGLGRVDGTFAGFIAPYLTGRVLDLGCGPQAVPSYLAEYPVELISGVDPLEPFEPHPFQFYRGFGEFLPWGDDTFDVVVNATSLDHSFSLDLVTKEIIRVLRPGGLLLVWEGFVKNSPPYRPSDPNLQPVDKFHFFHFDVAWFEEHFSHAFDVVEKLVLDESVWNPQYCSNNFYALRLRKPN